MPTMHIKKNNTPLSMRCSEICGSGMAWEHLIMGGSVIVLSDGSRLEIKRKV